MVNVNKGKISARLPNPSKRNQDVYAGYLSWIEKVGIKSSSITTIKGTPVQIMEHIKQDIDNLTVPDLKQFLRERGTPNNINRQEYSIRRFLEYLNEVGISTIEPDCLSRERFSRKEVKEQSREATPLTLNRVVEIRRQIKGNFRFVFAFEVTYVYGLSLEELENFSIEKYNPQSQTITFSTRQILVNDKIHSILVKHENVFKKTKTRYTYQHEYFKKIGELVNIDLIWSDIIATREKYFFCCSGCNNLFEPIPSNLALLQHVRTGDDDTIYLVCRECAQGGVLNV